MSDLIRREDAIMAIADSVQGCIPDTETMEKSIYTARLMLSDVPSVEPRKMNSREWKEFLAEQFGISKTSAKGMFHEMLEWKKNDTRIQALKKAT